MAGAHRKFAELLRHTRRRSTAALHKAMSLLSYAQHHVVKELVARWRRALAWWFWPHLGSLFVHVAYFLAVSWLGYLLLAQLRFRGGGTRRPRGIDLFFTSLSAATVSSMSTVEMEVFSNGQLLVLAVLMFVGGEVFLSLLGLASRWSKLRKQAVRQSCPAGAEIHDVAELEMPPVAAADIDHPTPIASTADEDMSKPLDLDHVGDDTTRLRRDAVVSLFVVVLAILLAVHVLGSVAIAAYILHASPAARRTLRGKALNVWTFAVFTTVSTFSNCGFMPTNENMIVFKKDTGLQLLLLPQMLAGNTLFPPLLAACVRAAAAATGRVGLKETAKRGGGELTGYYHLLPARRCAMLAATAAGLVAVQVAMLCGMEWGGALRGMSAREKVSNAVFLAVNSRHTGESTIDISTLAPAVLVLFVLTMYLPPYTIWFMFQDSSTAEDRPEKTQGTRLIKSTVLSQLYYLTIFVVVICITEREKLKEDPLNFNLLSIVVEVVSAYGNVGFSMGYSCSRQINPDQLCADRWTGFVGRWSDSGKLILILVMLFGRLRNSP